MHHLGARPFGRIALALPLAGCAKAPTNAGDQLLVAIIMGAGIFVGLLIVVPTLQNYLEQRDHRRRMSDRSWMKTARKKRGGR